MSKVIFFHKQGNHHCPPMTIRICLRSDGSQFETPLSGEYLNVVGYIPSTHRSIKVLRDYRYSYSWCASSWEVIPQLHNWGKMFLTYVDHTNLNFIGTPFEHRYNDHLSRHNSDHVDRHRLDRRARKELRRWGWGHDAFVPFKNPHPQGYQGVLINLNVMFDYSCRRLEVHDDYASGQHILGLGHK